MKTPHRSINVGLVDDHYLFRQGLAGLLENEHFHITLQAGNGKELIDLLPDHSIDLLLLDIEMPVMDGVETTDYLRKHYPDIRIIVLTMYNTEQYAALLLRKGVSGFLMKDSEIEEVQLAIDTVMSGKIFLTDRMDTGRVRQLSARMSKDDHINIASFTSREKEILNLLCEGKTNGEIGAQLFISPRTVEGHRKNLFVKTQSRNIAELVSFAYRNLLV